MTGALVVKVVAVCCFLASAIFIHYRGRVRHRFARQLTDHSTFLAPYSALVYLFSRVPAKPYLDRKEFPELDLLRDNWQTIRDEGVRLLDEGYVRAAASYNDLGFNSFFRKGWKRFYLKWYGDFLPSAKEMCPQTVALLNKLPNVHAAMFALLPPGGRLVRHRDPFAGSLRYHLGLRTANSPDCFIEVDGERYWWRDGEDVVFDETYIHWAENTTDVNRLILFCDVERPFRSTVMARVNRWISHHVVKASATQNVEGEHVGVLNRIFGYVYHVRVWNKQLKKSNRTAYYALKYVFFGGIVALLLL
jgi:beta-hydroxylase